MSNWWKSLIVLFVVFVKVNIYLLSMHIVLRPFVFLSDLEEVLDNSSYHTILETCLPFAKIILMLVVTLKILNFPMSIILLHPPPKKKLYFHLVQGSGVMGMGSRKLTKLCSGRRDSGISWLLQSPGLLVVLAVVLLRLPQGQLGLDSTVFLISFISSSGSSPCGNLKDERSVGQNPGQEDPESSGFSQDHSHGLSFTPTQSRGYFCISWTAQLWSWFCIL